MNKKNWIKIICFALCIVIVVSFLSQLFHYDSAVVRENIYSYQNVEKKTVDAVIIGTSGIHRYWIPGQAYTDYGITMYGLCMNGLMVYHILPMLKYALQYQNPKLVCIDIRPFLINENKLTVENMSVKTRYFNEILPMWSPLRLEATNRGLKYMSQVTDTSRFDLSYYFNILRYHDMWQNDLDFNVLKNNPKYTYGFIVTALSNQVKVMKTPKESDAYLDLAPLAQECLDELLAFADKKGIELVFVDTPHYINKTTAKHRNTMLRYLDEKGVGYLDFTTKENVERYPFDPAKDFMDSGHANYYGAVKFTEYFGTYLSENYGEYFEDRRNDPACNVWGTDYSKLLKTLQKKYNINVNR